MEVNSSRDNPLPWPVKQQLQDEEEDDDEDEGELLKSKSGDSKQTAGPAHVACPMGDNKEGKKGTEMQVVDDKVTSIPLESHLHLLQCGDTECEFEFTLYEFVWEAPVSKKKKGASKASHSQSLQPKVLNK